MSSNKLIESVNPLRKAGEILGRLESQDKTSAEVERFVSGEDKIKYGIHSQALRSEIVLTEKCLPGSFLEGYRAGMEEASENIRYSDLADSNNDHEFLYAGGD